MYKKEAVFLGKVLEYIPFFCTITLFGELMGNQNPPWKTKRDLCLGRESNPYGHCWPRDFKSRVSTYSTTKANGSAKIIHFLEK